MMKMTDVVDQMKAFSANVVGMNQSMKLTYDMQCCLPGSMVAWTTKFPAGMDISAGDGVLCHPQWLFQPDPCPGIVMAWDPWFSNAHQAACFHHRKMNPASMPNWDNEGRLIVLVGDELINVPWRYTWDDEHAYQGK